MALSASTPCGRLLRIVFKRPGELFRLLAHLSVDIENLRLQFLDAGMPVEQRRRLLGKLRTQGRTLFGKSANNVGVEQV